MNCALLTKIITVLIVVFLLSCIYNGKTEGYTHGSSARVASHQMVYDEAENQTPDNLIGMIYPPRAGPLHTNIEFPVKRDTRSRSFVAIYKDAPFLRYYGKKSETCA